MKKHSLIISVATDVNRCIGKNGLLPWSIPEDLERFKKLTSGHPVVMGKKTWVSLPKKVRPLPERTNIVITKDLDFKAEDARVAGSIEKALQIAKESPGHEKIFIIGGGQIYKQMINLVDEIYLTLVDRQVNGDTFFPEYENDFERIETGEKITTDGLTYRFETLRRKTAPKGGL